MVAGDAEIHLVLETEICAVPFVFTAESFIGNFPITNFQKSFWNFRDWPEIYKCCALNDLIILSSSQPRFLKFLSP